MKKKLTVRNTQRHFSLSFLFWKVRVGEKKSAKKNKITAAKDHDHNEGERKEGRREGEERKRERERYIHIRIQWQLL